MRRPPASTVVTGIVVVIDSSNSANTWKGSAAEPSELGAPAAFDVAVGSVPRPVIADNARATPPASSRYFVTNRPQSSVSGSTLRGLPKSTGTVHGPISNSAWPAKSGPQTLIFAPIEIEILIVPNQPRSISMPAEMRA